MKKNHTVMSQWGLIQSAIARIAEGMGFQTDAV